MSFFNCIFLWLLVNVKIFLLKKLGFFFKSFLLFLIFLKLCLSLLFLLCFVFFRERKFVNFLMVSLLSIMRILMVVLFFLILCFLICFFLVIKGEMRFRRLWVIFIWRLWRIGGRVKVMWVDFKLLKEKCLIWVVWVWYDWKFLEL